MNPAANRGAGEGPPNRSLTKQDQDSWRFVQMLKRLVEQQNLGALAALRRGLGRPAGSVSEMYPWVIPWLPEGVRQSDEDAYYLVASLFAWHRTDWATGQDSYDTSFGASCRRLLTSSSSDSIEHRFVALLNASRNDLPVHLRHMVGLLKSHDVPINWTKLLRDILAWDHPDRYAQRAWARAYWRS